MGCWVLTAVPLLGPVYLRVGPTGALQDLRPPLLSRRMADGCSDGSTISE